MKELGMYVHIPFCIRKCQYCDFISFENQQSKTEEYVNAIVQEIKGVKTEIGKKELSTIYIGGGTPSILEIKEIEKIIDTIKKEFTISKSAEITIEVNPGTVSKNKLETYQRIGINRISIGLQSTNNEILKQIGRIHTYEQFLATYQMAREVGFQNCNVDLMLALPRQTIEILEESLEKVIALQPEHISVYSLILEENTPMFQEYQYHEVIFPNEEKERNMYWRVKEILEEKGYQHYEISNFAKPGYESKHNVNCWNQEEYIGIGLAAHSYYQKTRYSNTTNLVKYIENIQKGFWKKNRQIQEEQTKEEQQREYMLLGLRKLEGVSIIDFKNKFFQNPIDLYNKEVEKLVRQELIQIRKQQIQLTQKGLDFANLVWEEFV